MRNFRLLAAILFVCSLILNPSESAAKNAGNGNSQAAASNAKNDNAKNDQPKNDRDRDEKEKLKEKVKTHLWRNKIEKLTNQAYDAAKKRDAALAKNRYNFQLAAGLTTDISFSDSLKRIKTGVVDGRRGISFWGRNTALSADGYSRLLRDYSINLVSEKRLPASVAILDDCLAKAKVAIAGNQILVIQAPGLTHFHIFESEAQHVLNYWYAFTRLNFDGYDDEKRKVVEEKYLAQLKSVENLVRSKSGFGINLDNNPGVACSLSNP